MHLSLGRPSQLLGKFDAMQTLEGTSHARGHILIT